MTKRNRSIWNYWDDFPLVDDFIDFLKRYALPGFQGVSFYTVLSFIYREIMRNDIITRANSVAFSIFLSLFPTIIFFFTLIPLFPVSADYLSILRESTENIFPKEAHNYLFSMVEEVVSIKRGGLQSLGFLLAMFFSSSGMLELMNGFEKSYEHAFKKRNFLKKRGIALLLVITHASIMFLTMLLLVFGQGFIDQFIVIEQNQQVIPFLLFVGKWLLMLFLVYFAVTTIYRYGPSLKERVNWLNPGSILATILTILVSIGFSIVINNFGKYNEIYGSIGALLVFLIWLQINALIILIGFELNASIMVNKIKSTREIIHEKIFTKQ